MAFVLPQFTQPDFDTVPLKTAPLVRFERAVRDGVAPENYHATTVYPEYFHLSRGRWQLLAESRMDCVVVRAPGGRLAAREFRRLACGDEVACGRSENGEEGIFVHADPFRDSQRSGEKFAFRSHHTRETSFSIDYDELYDLLAFERRNGFIAWVLGPALAFDRDARGAFCELVAEGYVHGLLAGNALATHDVEGALFGTALGQGIYDKKPVAFGHYRHLDALNRIRRIGSLQRAVESGQLTAGILHAIFSHGIPCVLAGSIRDDGPMPEVVADVYAAQDRMRAIIRRATTIIALATQLHTIAVGNMAPAYKVMENGDVRPVYFYTVDMSEFAVSKLANRGSLTARAILTNVQDFVVTVERGLRGRQ